MNHYRQSNMESIEVMHEFLPHDQFLGFLLGNVYKYLHRHPHKGDAFGDIDKAIVYLKAYRDCMENSTIKNPFTHQTSVSYGDYRLSCKCYDASKECMGLCGKI